MIRLLQVQGIIVTRRVLNSVLTLVTPFGVRHLQEVRMESKKEVMKEVRAVINGLNGKWVLYDGYETVKVSNIIRLIENRLEDSQTTRKVKT